MQKAGTTWLFSNLKSHPRFFPAALKEPHYFDGWYYWPRLLKSLGHDYQTGPRDNRILATLLDNLEHSLASMKQALDDNQIDRLRGSIWWSRRLPPLARNILSPEWYEKVFAGGPASSICGDFTADTYLLDAEGIDAILEWNPDAKFVMLLRDPVSRDWSQIRMIRRQTPNRSYDEILRSPELMRRNEYRSILTLWEARVGSERLHIDFYDSVRSEPKALLDRICTFLQVEPRGDDWPNADEVGFPGPKIELPTDLRQRLIERNARSLDYLASRFGSPCTAWAEKYF